MIGHLAICSDAAAQWLPASPSRAAVVCFTTESDNFYPNTISAPASRTLLHAAASPNYEPCSIVGEAESHHAKARYIADLSAINI